MTDEILKLLYRRHCNRLSARERPERLLCVASWRWLWLLEGFLDRSP